MGAHFRAVPEIPEEHCILSELSLIERSPRVLAVFAMSYPAGSLQMLLHSAVFTVVTTPSHTLPSLQPSTQGDVKHWAQLVAINLEFCHAAHITRGKAQYYSNTVA